MPRPRTFNEEQVLDQVVEVFRVRGFEATSVADLESATGLGRQSLYNAFGDKRALFDRALDRYRAQASDARASLAGTGLQGIRSLLLSSVESLTAESERCGCLLTRTRTEWDAGQELPAACGANDRALEGFFRDRLEEAATAGALDAEVEPSRAAGLLLTFVHGLSTMASGGAAGDGLKAQVELLLDRLGTAAG